MGERIKGFVPQVVPPKPVGARTKTKTKPEEGFTFLEDLYLNKDPELEVSSQESESFWDQFVQDWEKKWPQYVLGTYGGIKGAKRGAQAGSFFGPYGKAVGGVVGAGIGAATGRGLQLSPEIYSGQMTPTQASVEIWGASSEEMLNEMFGLGLNKAIKPIIEPVLKILTPYRRGVTERAKDAYRTISEAAPKGFTPLTPAELTKRPWLVKFQHIMSSNLASFGVLQRYMARREDVLKHLTDDAAAMYGSIASESDIGKMIAHIATENARDFNRRMVAPLYKTVENEVGDLAINTAAVKEIAKDAWSRVEGLHLKKDRIKELGLDLIQSVKKWDNALSFTKLETFAGVLKASIRTGNKDEKRIAYKLLQPLEELIARAVKEKSERGYKVLKLARHQASKNIKIYKNNLINHLVDLANPRTGRGAEPHKILKTALENRAVETIKAVKNAIGYKKFQELKAWHVAQLFFTPEGKALPKGTDILKKMFNPKTGMGEAGMKIIYTPQELARMKSVAEAIEYAQEKLPSAGGATLLVHLLQAALLGGVAATVLRGQGITAGQAVGTVGLLFSPRVLTRMMLDPKYSRALVKGLKVPHFTGPVAARYFNAAERALDEITREDKQERLNRAREWLDEILPYLTTTARPEFFEFTPFESGPERIMGGPGVDFYMDKPGGDIRKVDRRPTEDHMGD